MSSPVNRLSSSRKYRDLQSNIDAARAVGQWVGDCRGRLLSQIAQHHAPPYTCVMIAIRPYSE
eukprot:scaffold670097_cov83-Prasinocladus_malaysianus.AAC.1